MNLTPTTKHTPSPQFITGDLIGFKKNYVPCYEYYNNPPRFKYLEWCTPTHGVILDSRIAITITFSVFIRCCKLLVDGNKIVWIREEDLRLF